MSHTEKVSDLFGEYTEIIEDEKLAALREAGTPVAYMVVEDEWNADFTLRIIRRAEIVEVSVESA